MTIAATSTASGGAGSVFVTIIFITLSIGFYWTPTIISAIRHLPHTGSVAATNAIAFLIIPWWIAFIAAVRSQPKPQYVVPSGWQPPQDVPRR